MHPRQSETCNSDHFTDGDSHGPHTPRDGAAEPAARSFGD
jgi:hypothetical protein